MPPLKDDANIRHYNDIVFEYTPTVIYYLIVRNEFLFAAAPIRMAPKYIVVEHAPE